MEHEYQADETPGYLEGGGKRFMAKMLGKPPV